MFLLSLLCDIMIPYSLLVLSMVRPALFTISSSCLLYTSIKTLFLYDKDRSVSFLPCEYVSKTFYPFQTWNSFRFPRLPFVYRRFWDGKDSKVHEVIYRFLRYFYSCLYNQGGRNFTSQTSGKLVFPDLSVLGHPMWDDSLLHPGLVLKCDHTLVLVYSQQKPTTVV